MTPRIVVVALALAACGPPGRAGLTTGAPRAEPRRHTSGKTRTPRRRIEARPPRPAPASGDTTVERCRTLVPTAKAVAGRHTLDVGLLIAIARVESRFNPAALNKRSGATGLMQLMPSTAKYFECGDMRDAGANLECGARVLRRYIDYFDGDLTYGIAAYHSGPRSPKRAKKRGKLPKNFNYVQKVMQWRARFLREGCF